MHTRQPTSQFPHPPLHAYTHPDTEPGEFRSPTATAALPARLERPQRCRGQTRQGYGGHGMLVEI